MMYQVIATNPATGKTFYGMKFPSKKFAESQAKGWSQKDTKYTDWRIKKVEA